MSEASPGVLATFFRAGRAAARDPGLVRGWLSGDHRKIVFPRGEKQLFGNIEHGAEAKWSFFFGERGGW